MIFCLHRPFSPLLRGPLHSMGCSVPQHVPECAPQNAISPMSVSVRGQKNSMIKYIWETLGWTGIFTAGALRTFKRTCIVGFKGDSQLGLLPASRSAFLTLAAHQNHLGELLKKSRCPGHTLDQWLTHLWGETQCGYFLPGDSNGSQVWEPFLGGC